MTPHFALLPSGFFDVLEDQAETQERLRSALLCTFQQYGYRLVRPPLMEFETSLYAEAGQKLRTYSFQLIDPISHQLMGIRPDMTTQVARIAVSRLVNAPRPLRLCYAGEVLRTKGEGLEGRRQRTQVGYELIGLDTVEADIEVMRVAIDALVSLGVKDLGVDMIIPPVVRELCDHLQLDQETRTKLKEALSKKDIHLIKSLTGDSHSLLVPLITLYSSVHDTVRHIESLPLSKTTLSLCARLRRILELLAKQYPNINLSVDAAESDYFEYHTGIGFSIFSIRTSVELGRGGRYIVTKSAGEEPASGFTLYLDSVVPLLPEQSVAKSILVPIDCDVSVLEELRQKGYQTIYGSSSGAMQNQAQQLGCEGWFEEGTIRTVR